jgi:putative peptidoglycan lipid II flippase
VPALFGVSVSQINLLFDTLLATMLASGSVAWLYYSDRLMELPLGIFGIAIAIVVLPSLSRKHATSSLNDFAETLDWAFRLVVLIAIPSALALIVIAEPLLIALFHNDKFTAVDVSSSAGSLKAYALGLIAFMSIKIFAPGYYARQNTSTPVKIGIVAMVSNMAMNLVFFIGGLAHVGLALATSLAAFLNAGLLLRGLTVDGVFKFQPGWGIFLFRIVLANALMVFFLISFAGDWQDWLSWTMTDKIFRLGILVVGAVFIYPTVLFAAGLRWRHIYR